MVCSTKYVNSRRSRYVPSVFFVTFFAAFSPSTMLTFQENFPKLIASLDSSIPSRQANYPFVRPNVTLGRTWPDDLLVWMNKFVVFEKSSSDGQTCLKICLPRFHITICPSETICPSRWFVCLNLALLTRTFITCYSKFQTIVCLLSNLYKTLNFVLLFHIQSHLEDFKNG